MNSFTSWLEYSCCCYCCYCIRMGRVVAWRCRCLWNAVVFRVIFALDQSKVELVIIWRCSGESDDVRGGRAELPLDVGVDLRRFAPVLRCVGCGWAATGKKIRRSAVELVDVQEGNSRGVVQIGGGGGKRRPRLRGSVRRDRRHGVRVGDRSLNRVALGTQIKACAVVPLSLMSEGQGQSDVVGIFVVQTSKVEQVLALPIVLVVGSSRRRTDRMLT